jgi:hypothetical protein
LEKVNTIKIRVYKSTENIQACLRFSEGHGDVLKSYNIKKVTSANTAWYQDPGVYLIMIESQSGNEVYGGARFHLKNKNTLLPVEEAIGEIDTHIFKLTGSDSNIKTGEMCGMWNKRDMTGNGLSILLMRVGIAKCTIFIAEKHKIDKVFAFCAPWTVKMCEDIGFTIENSVGNNGEFFYPTPELIASVYSIKDIETLKKATNTDRDGIFDLRKNPVQKRKENGPKGQIIVEYDLMMNHELHSSTI